MPKCDLAASSLRIHQTPRKRAGERDQESSETPKKILKEEAVVSCCACDVVLEEKVTCVLQHSACKSCIQRMVNSSINHFMIKVICPKADCQAEVLWDELFKIEPSVSMFLYKRHLTRMAGMYQKTRQLVTNRKMGPMRVELRLKRYAKTTAQGSAGETGPAQSSVLPLLTSDPRTPTSYPLNWTGASQVQSVDLDSPEGLNVRASLQDETLSIRRIVRVENKDVWHNYCQLKKEMLCQLTRKELHEQFLFATVFSEQVDVIQERGFETDSVPKAHTAVSGIRFVKQASLLLQDGLTTVNNARPVAPGATTLLNQATTLAPRGAAVVITQVLVGSWKTMNRTALVMARCEQNETCDSWADSELSPSRFVVFKGSQCYPAYVVWM